MTNASSIDGPERLNPPEKPESPQPQQDVRLLAGVVASALFMQNMDGTVVATALPSMAHDFAVSAATLSSTITAYLIALTVFIPVSGWVADRFGAKRIFLLAIAVFTVSSALCAMSTTLAQLIGARILQGVGGAMMVPVGRLILFRRARREELLTATTWLTMPALIGPIVGPPLGGALTDALSWHSVFWINLPVGIVGFWLAWRWIPATPSERPPAPDLAGMASIGASLTLLMFGLETLGRGGISLSTSMAALAVGVGLYFWTKRHCRRIPHPAIDFTLLRIPTFHASTVAGSLFRVGAGALPFLVPVMLQLGFGMSASLSGLTTFASALGSLCMRPMTSLALRHFSMRTVLIFGSISFAAMLAMCALINADWPRSLIFALLLVGGLCRSLSFASLGALAFADVPPPQLSAATSLQGTAQQLTKAVGVALAASALQCAMSIDGHAAPQRGDFAWAFLVVAAVVLASWPMLARLHPDAGAGIAAKRAAKRASKQASEQAPTRTP